MTTSPGKSARKETAANQSPRSKRKQIIEAAIKVFLLHGYAATTLAKVAEEANVIRATIYSHFADKDELFKAIIEELTVKQMGANFQQRIMSASPKEFVYLMRDFVQARKKDKNYLALLRTVIGESERFPELARLYFQTVYSQGMLVAESYFSKHPELEIADAQALTAVVGGSMMAHLIQQELLRGKEIVPMDLNKLADTLADLLSRKKQKDSEIES
ncbi:MAG: TetR/AcrR family transcriptional regulator [Candidatus Obscuribacterales bacterium]|nr:TetR/AcrR family transcriptional regulator [Candidatus Obscuribacterales bacterium]